MKDIERMVISAHRDGEVEAPWKDQVARKIAEDPAWAAEAAVLDRLGLALATSPEPDFAPARDRVWTALAAGTRPAEIRRLPVLGLVAAAALVVLAAGGGYWWGRSSVPSGPAEVAELQVQVPKQLELQLSGEGQLLMASTLEGNRP